MPYKFSAITCFLTYPQFDNFSKEELLSALRLKFTIEDYIIAKEQHEDGHDHYHAVLRFENKFSTRDERFFDIAGHHPNIQNPRSLKDVAKYCKKEGDFICSHEDFPGKVCPYAKALEEAKSKDEFLDMLRERDPKGLCKSFSSIRACAEHFFTKRVAYVPKYKEELFNNVPDVLKEWRDTEFKV